MSRKDFLERLGRDPTAPNALGQPVASPGSVA